VCGGAVLVDSKGDAVMDTQYAIGKYLLSEDKGKPNKAKLKKKAKVKKNHKKKWKK